MTDIVKDDDTVDHADADVDVLHEEDVTPQEEREPEEAVFRSYQEPYVYPEEAVFVEYREPEEPTEEAVFRP